MRNPELRVKAEKSELVDKASSFKPYTQNICIIISIGIC